MEKINLVIVGYGGMGGHHADNLKSYEEYYNIMGILDIDPKRYDVAKERQVPNYDRYHTQAEVAADKNVNTVIIATPNDTHLPLVEYFAKAGKNIICEKPIAMDYKEYLQMLKTCKECGVLFMVHQNRRWDKDFLTMKAIWESKKIGDFWRVESRVQGANGIPGGWRKVKECGGGMMLDWGVHLIDQFVYMLDELPESVYADYSYELGFEVEDSFKIQLRYKSGLTVEITVDTNCFYPLPRWVIYGKEGTAYIKDWSVTGEIIKPIFGKELKIVGITAGNGFTKTMAYRSPDSIVKEDIPSVDVPFRPFYKEYYDVLMTGKEPIIKPHQVLAVLNIMESAKISADTKKAVVIDYKKCEY